MTGPPLPAPRRDLVPIADLSGDLVPLFLLRYDRPNTRRSYGHALRVFFGADAVTLAMARAVTFVDVNGHLAGLEAEGKKPATLRQRAAVLRAFFGWLIALRGVRRNPADRMLVRRIPVADWRTRSVRVLTSEEAGALVATTDPSTALGARDRALLLVLLKGCLRRSEAVGLDFSDVRPVGDYWTLQIASAKGGAGQYVKATEDVVAAVANVRDRCGWEDGPIFRCLARGPKYGARLSGQGVDARVRLAAKRAGLPPVSPHVLRHTGCTLAFEGGARIEQVQAHARHVLVGTTLVYVHQRDKLGNSAADVLADYLAASEPSPTP